MAVPCCYEELLPWVIWKILKKYFVLPILLDFQSFLWIFQYTLNIQIFELKSDLWDTVQSTLTWSKLKIETVELDVKYVQRWP